MSSVMTESALVPELFRSPFGGSEAQETNGIGNVDLQTRGAVPPALHVMRQRAAEHPLARSPALAVNRDEVAKGRGGKLHCRNEVDGFLWA